MMRLLIVLTFIITSSLFSYEDKSVNVITGAYQETETDYTEKSERPLTLKRFYSSYQDGSQSWTFNLPNIINGKGEKPKMHPSEYEIVNYSYNGKGCLVSVTKKSNNILLGSIQFLYGKSVDTCDITTSDGKSLRYVYEKGKRNEVLLKAIYVDGVLTTKYEYTYHSNKKNVFLTKRTLANGEQLLIDYDMTTGKVKSLTSSQGKTTFVYKGKTTEVIDPKGIKEIHTITDQGHLASTATYNEAGALSKTVNYRWKEIDGKPYLTFKQVKDGLGNTLFTELKSYTNTGLIAEETLQGDLKGLGGQENYTKRYTYDVFNLLREISDGFVTTKLTYDARFNVQAQYTLEGNKIKERAFFTYDDLGFLSTIISDDGSSEIKSSLNGVTERWLKQFYRTKEGVLKETKTFATDLKTGKEVLFKQTEPIKEQEKELVIPTEDTKTYTYDSLGRIKTVKNEKGDVTTISYTSLGKPKTITYPDGTFENFTYEINGLPKTHENLLGHMITRTYDYKGRVIKEVKTVYNELLSEKNYTYSAFHLIQDDQGRYTYSLFGDLKTFTSNVGDVHEIDGNTIKSSFTNGDVISQTFDRETGESIAESNGLVKKIKQQKPLEIQPAPGKEYIFGPQNRLEKTIEAGNKITLYTYDKWGRLQTAQKPNGVSLYYEYNSASRISSITSSDQSIDYSYIYNNEGLPIQVKDLIGTSIRVYKEDKLISETLSNGHSLYFTYDKRGRRESVTLPDGSSIHYSYDPFYLREVKRVSKSGETLYTHTYDSFDEEGRLLKSTSITKNSNNKLFQELSFDSKGNVIEIKEESSTKTFSYNELDELDLRPKETFNNSSLNYDLNGNLKEANGWLLSYDAFDRLILAEKDTTQVRYNYDFLGRRMTKTVFEESALSSETLYLYDSQEEIGSVNKDKEIKELKILGLSGPIALELEGEIFLPVLDYLGSIRELISFKTAERIEKSDYTPFGEGSSQTSPWGFCGKRQDTHTTLLNFGRRDLDPKTGLWITKDPLHGIDGENPYIYCRNNPLTRKDLFGLYSFNKFIDDTVSFFSKTKENLQQFKDEYAFENVYQYEIHAALRATFGDAFFYLVGYHIDPSETGVFGNGECNEKVRITFINGILNDRVYFTEAVTDFSRSHGYNNVHFVFRNTEGWTRDVINGLVTKMGLPSSHSVKLAALWREQIAEMGGTEGGGVIIHYSHSLGGADTVCALHMMTEDERKMIRVVTIGSPISIPNHLAQSAVNYGSCRDIVSIFNLLNHIHSFLPHKYNVVFLGSMVGIPMIDHYLSMPTYATLLEELGREFVETYSQESN